MQIFQTKTGRLTGTDFREVHKKALNIYQEVRRKTKRRPYIRSAYFQKDKIFLDIFWQHLFDKVIWRDRFRRIQYFAAGIELIKNSKYEPESKENPNNKSELLHRFSGTTKEKQLFFVQIKENKKTRQKYLISIFPYL